MKTSRMLSIDNQKRLQSDGSKESFNLSPHDHKSRDKRASEYELSLELARMQKIARLATGISIQQGLMSETLTLRPDDLVSELLHLGSVSPTQIIDLNSTSIQNALTDIRNLPMALKNTMEIERMASKMEDHVTIRELVKKNGTQWVGRNEFVAAMELVRNEKSEMKLILDANGLVGNWFISHEKLMPPNINLADAKNNMRNFKKLTENINAIIPQLIGIEQNGITLPNITSVMTGLEPLSTLTSLYDLSLKTFSHSTYVGDRVFLEAEVDNIKNISRVSKILRDVNMTLINTVVRARTFQSELPSSKFPGFQKGYSDANELFNDLNDPWLKTVVNPDAISAALSPLKTLEPQFKAADTMLISPRYDRHSIMTRQYFEMVDGILKLSTSSEDIVGAFEKTFTCDMKSAPFPDSSFSVFIQLAEKLDATIRELNKFLIHFLRVLNNEETKNQTKEVVKLFETLDGATQMKEIVDAVKGSEELAQLNRKMILTFTWQLPNPKRDAESILAGVNTVDNFVSKLTKYDFHSFFNCLINLKDEEALIVKNGVTASKLLKSRMISWKTGETVINNVVKSGSRLKSLLDAIAKVKDHSTPESDSLELFLNHQKHAMVIGSATRRVSAMVKALEKEFDAAIIIEHVKTVKEQMTIVKNQDIVRNLRSVVRLGESLEMMYQKLRNWRDGVNSTTSTALASHADLFSSATMVPGITEDFGGMANSVGVLKEQVSDPNDKAQLEAVKDALESLAAINLNFDSFATAQMTQVNESLAAMDLFFANFNSVSVTGAPNASGVVVGPEQLVSKATSTKTAGSSIGIVLGSLLGVGVIVGAVGGLIWFVKRKKAKMVEVSARDAADILPPPPTAEVKTTSTSGSV